MFNRIFQQINDFVFPIFCLGCEKEGTWVCDSCLLTIGTYGIKESGDKNLNFLYSIALYKQNSLVGKMIHTFKYEYVAQMTDHFKRLVESYLKNKVYRFSEIDFVAPVPLHRVREAERGFNQSALLAKILANKLDLPVCLVLQRKRCTKPQKDLDKDERIKNVESAFVCIDSDFVALKKVLLVDDVYTTGSTMRECAKVLRRAGATDVNGFTLARAVF